MRVFVARSSGVVGRSLADRLVDAGHEVTGTTRSPDRAPEIGLEGARPVLWDALGLGALARAVAEARPEVVINELTAIPHRFDLRNREPAIA